MQPGPKIETPIGNHFRAWGQDSCPKYNPFHVCPNLEQRFLPAMGGNDLESHGKIRTLSFYCAHWYRNSWHASNVGWCGENIFRIHREWIGFGAEFESRCGCRRRRDSVNSFESANEFFSNLILHLPSA